jgi:Icc-related predicted phosphoesterase
MRVFAVSDLHVDYPANAQWVAELSISEYRDDIMIVAGDISNSLPRLERTLSTLAARFRRVLYVPGNHELWVTGDEDGKSSGKTSLTKFEQVCAVAEEAGASMRRYDRDGLSIVPLLGWYDYSFGQPSQLLLDSWMDYRACRWPRDFAPPDVAAHFEKLNDTTAAAGDAHVITFSHFLPRIDVMPEFIPQEKRLVYPVLGAARLDEQVRKLRPKMHVYGHSHVNRRVDIDGVTYINNAFGYPHETRITAKQLLCIHET